MTYTDITSELRAQLVHHVLGNGMKADTERHNYDDIHLELSLILETFIRAYDVSLFDVWEALGRPAWDEPQQRANGFWMEPDGVYDVLRIPILSDFMYPTLWNAIRAYGVAGDES